MKIIKGQRLKIAYRLQGQRKDRVLQGVVISVTERFFTVQTLMGYRESVDFVDLKTGRAKIMNQEENDVEDKSYGTVEPITGEPTGVMTFAEILQEKGLTGLLSEAMVERVPREKIIDLLDRGLGTKKAAKELEIGLGTFITLKKFYDLMDYGKGKSVSSDPSVVLKSEEQAPYKTVEEKEQVDDQNIKASVPGGIPSEDPTAKYPEKEFTAQLLTVEKPIMEINYKGTAKICTELAEFAANTLMSLRDDSEGTQMDIQIVVRSA